MILKKKCSKGIFKNDITLIELSKHKINFTTKGAKKLSKFNIHDTVNILGISFFIADGSSSYFPDMPIIIKLSTSQGHSCIYMIDHLTPSVKNRILEIFTLVDSN
jgi:hypothetical protein